MRVKIKNCEFNGIYRILGFYRKLRHVLESEDFLTLFMHKKILCEIVRGLKIIFFFIVTEFKFFP